MKSTDGGTSRYYKLEDILNDIYFIEHSGNSAFSKMCTSQALKDRIRYTIDIGYNIFSNKTPEPEVFKKSEEVKVGASKEKTGIVDNEGWEEMFKKAFKESSTYFVEHKVIPYQLCPKCLGSGIVSPSYNSTATSHQCPVCQGKMIIPQCLYEVQKPI